MDFNFNQIEGLNNKLYVKKFLKTMESRAGERRGRDLFDTLRAIFRFMPKDFKSTSRDDFERLSISLIKHGYSYNTLACMHSRLKVFIRHFEDLESNENLPKKYLSLKMPKDKSKYKIFKGIEDIKSPEQALTDVKRAKSKRDAAAYLILADGGLRPSELLLLTKKNIIRNDLGYWYVHIPRGKTGFRKVRLIFSLPAVEDYFNTLNSLNASDKLFNFSSTVLNRITKYIGNINPYNLRHSSASFYASILTESELCERYGWIQGSRVLQVYVHLNQKQVDYSLNKAFGISNGNSNEKEDILNKIKPVTCLTCGSFNLPDIEICKSCKNKLITTIEEKIEKEKLDSIAYSASEKLMELDMDAFKEIARSFGAEIKENV